jgi:predicted double-glycine peptidase
MLFIPSLPASVSNVPFYSQFVDIEAASWKKVGCGITSLAMVIDFYNPGPVSVNKLLGQGIAIGAYDNNAGWIYSGLINVAKKYDLKGTTYDFGKSSAAVAFAQFKNYVKDGPVIVSVHYKFDPKNPIPHLVVINGINNGVVYYNDPAAKTGEKEIAVTDFLKAWKKRFIVLRPIKADGLAMVTTK